MTSFETVVVKKKRRAASPATATQRTEKAPRERISEFDGVVSIRVPALRERGGSKCFEDVTPQGTKGRLVQFAYSVSGGLVNIRVRGKNPATLCGSTIKGKPQIFKKKLSDGRVFLEIDIWPVPDQTRVTHRLVVLPSIEKLRSDPSVLEHRFDTPPPLKGVIGFARQGVELSFK